jgi:HSP20 family protein
MSRLERYLAQIHSVINRAFERFFENPIWERPMSMMPAINMKDDGNQYLIEAEMPGLEDEDVEIEVHGRQITIKGKREQKEQKQGEQMYISERRYDSFYRTITLPQDANLDHITAYMKMVCCLSPFRKTREKSRGKSKSTEINRHKYEVPLLLRC